MTDLKVVQLKRDDTQDYIQALKAIVSALESGEQPAVETGILVLMSADGMIDTFGFGPRSDELQIIGLMRLGEQVIIESAMYPDQ